MTVNTITMGPGTLTIGDVGDLTTFSSQITNCRVTPNVDTGDPINVLSGETVPGDRDETWTLAGSLVQDLGAGIDGADSKVEWLHANAGTTFPFTFIPATAAGRKITGNVTVEAVEIGGDVKSKPTSDFEWQISGRPAIATAA
jgi:hypothetical protein